jgi:tight adherence protein C
MTPGLWTETAVAVVLGAVFGVGVCLLLSLAPRVRAATLATRIAPYIRDVIDPMGLGPAPTPVVSAGELLRSIPRRLGAMLGGADAVERRLQQAGWAMDAAGFRSRQLVWGLVGLGVGGVVVIAGALVGSVTPAAVLVPPLFAAAGAIVCDVRLGTAARARMRRVEEELPTVLDFLALCLAAGEGILDSLRRVGRIGSGELTSEIRVAVLAVGTGEPLADALVALGRRMGVPALARAIDQVVAALERGAPLAQVLQAQAGDTREDAKRALIEQAGRKEILMLVPLVFLILPLSVLYAVFPGVVMLRLGIG